MKCTVLGFDVSSSSTGWAVIKSGRFYKRKGKDYGIISFSKKLSHSNRLSLLRVECTRIIEKVKPDIVIIEDVFVGRNPKTTILLSRYSGVVIESVYSTLKKDPIIFTVKEIRKIIGSQDSKEESFKFIKKKFKLSSNWQFKSHNDIIDGLAAALSGYIRFKESKK